MKVDQGGQPYGERKIDKLRPARQTTGPKSDSAPPGINPPLNRQAPQIQRTAAAKNLVLNALESVKAWLESEQGQNENKRLDEGPRFIAELHEKARLQNEHVLEPYRQRLTRIVQERDEAFLAELITGLRAEIEQILPESDIRNVADQNRLAAQSALEADSIDGMMRSVVRDLKGAADPPFNLKRDRVIDLLG